MDRHRFWQIIGNARQAAGQDDDYFLELVEQQLLDQCPRELIQFHEIAIELFHEAEHDDLWAAAFIINAGCSDDGFMDFRDWLISQGRQVYQKAMNDPETLADHVVMDTQWEAEGPDVRRSARHVYKLATKEEIPPVPRLPQPTLWRTIG